MSYALMLHPSWPATFRRTLYDEAGLPVLKLVFEENKPLEVNDDAFAALYDDIGKALVYAQRDAQGKPIPKVDQFDHESEPVNPRGRTFFRADLVDGEAPQPIDPEQNPVIETNGGPTDTIVPGDVIHLAAGEEITFAAPGEEPGASQPTDEPDPAPEADDQPSRRNRRRR